MRWPKLSLTWRLLAIGVAQLFLLTAVFVVVGFLFIGPHGPPHPPGPPGPRPPAAPMNMLFIGAIVIVCGGAMLTARSIIVPLRKLSSAADALGEGDLRARSNVSRSDELGDLSRAFDAMAQRMERLVLAEKELLANVSHELRTPLARIRVALDIAGEGDAEAQRVSLSEIAIDLTELETLVDDILAATRLELTGGVMKPAHFELHLEVVSPNTLCERAAERFRSRHPGRQLTLDISAGRSANVEVDPMLFRRVLDNLLDNAQKYSPDDTLPIVLRAAASDDVQSFEVEDHGTGIPADDIGKLFTPFFRGDRSRTRGTGGVGLGLTLARRVVEAHGGTIAVNSKLDQGTRVKIRLPMHQR